MNPARPRVPIETMLLALRGDFWLPWPLVGDLAVGQLAPIPQNGYPLAKQPAGVGTPVTDPTQPPIQTITPQPVYVGAPQEKLSMFFPGCGHSIMSWYIGRAAVTGVPSALVQCPLCGYIQSIRTPYTLLDAEDIILG